MGGLPASEERNKVKARLIYDVIDTSDGFYKGHAEKRSQKPHECDLQSGECRDGADFAAKAKANDFIGVKGHRLVGGLRVSLYNAVTPEAAEALSDFMKEYMRVNG